MKKVFALLLTLSMLLCTACALAENAPAEENKNFTVTLVGNPTTGYEWLHVIGDDTIISVTEEFLTAEDIDKLAEIEGGAEMLCGGPGLYVFTVKGLKPGTTLVAFEYAQSWEEDSSVAGLTFSVTVLDDLSVVCNGVLGNTLPD